MGTSLRPHFSWAMAEGTAAWQLSVPELCLLAPRPRRSFGTFSTARTCWRQRYCTDRLGRDLMVRDPWVMPLDSAGQCPAAYQCASCRAWFGYRGWPSMRHAAICCLCSIGIDRMAHGSSAMYQA